MMVKELKELIEYTFDDPKYNMNKSNEKLMIVKCLESEEYWEEGEIYYAVTEHNFIYNCVFYKVIDNVRPIFLNCPSRDSMLEIFEILLEKEITFEKKQKWAYGDMWKEHPEYFPAKIWIKN